MARLGDICKFQSGGTPSKGEPSYFNGNIPWITTVALNGSVIDESHAVDWITEKAIEKSAAKIVPANSVMVGTRVGVGKVAINKVPMSTSQDIISLLDIDESKWSKEFICKFILGKGTYLNSQARGATIKGIKIETLAGLQLPDIPIEQQCKIATVIDAVDDLIALRKEQLTKLDKLVKSRFIELFGDPITNSNNLPTERMELRFNLKAGITTAADDIHEFEEGVYEIPCYGGNGIRGYVREKSYTGNYPIIGRQGALCGNVQYAAGDFHATEHAVLVSLLKDDNAIWVYHLLKLMDLYRYHTGAAQPGLAVKTLNTVEVIVADRYQQDKFAAFFEQTDKSKLAIQQSLDKLELLKKSLMQEYFE